MADVFNIAGRIHSTSQEEVVTTTNEILDATQEKKQSEVNQEVNEELALHTNRLNALTGQNYVTVVATQSTTAADIPTLINASGEGEQTDTLYRVGFWDGSAYVADKYTEYAWNGTAYVILDVKSSIGEVFDISQYNAVGGTLTPYVDLEAALGTSGANVPSSVRRGGMSIKFVQSSDNKYVQYRYMSSSTAVADFTNVSNWQGITENLVDESKDLITSGGVDKVINSVLQQITKEYTFNDFSDDGWQWSDAAIRLEEGHKYAIKTSGDISAANLQVCFMDGSTLQSVITSKVGIEKYITATYPVVKVRTKDYVSGSIVISIIDVTSYVYNIESLKFLFGVNKQYSDFTGSGWVVSENEFNLPKGNYIFSIFGDISITGDDKSIQCLSYVGDSPTAVWTTNNTTARSFFITISNDCVIRVRCKGYVSGILNMLVQAVPQSKSTTAIALCSTAANVANKTISLYTDFKLEEGSRFIVIMQNTSTTFPVTLKIGNYDAYELYFNNIPCRAGNIWGSNAYLDVYYRNEKFYAKELDNYYFDLKTSKNGYYTDAGLWVDNESYKTSDRLYIQSGVEYYTSANYIVTFDANGNFIERLSSLTTTNHTFTSNVAYIRLCSDSSHSLIVILSRDKQIYPLIKNVSDISELVIGKDYQKQYVTGKGQVKELYLISSGNYSISWIRRNYSDWGWGIAIAGGTDKAYSEKYNYEPNGVIPLYAETFGLVQKTILGYCVIDWSKQTDDTSDGRSSTINSLCYTLSNCPIIESYLGKFNPESCILPYLKAQSADIAFIRNKVDKELEYIKKYGFAAISWVDDDFMVNQENYVAKYNAMRTWCNQNGIHADIALIPSDVLVPDADTETQLATKINAVRSWAEDGFHFLYHPVHYGWYGTVDLAKVRKQILDCLRVFNENSVPSKYKVLVYPGSSFEVDGVEDLAKEYFNLAININNGFNIGNGDQYQLNRVFPEYYFESQYSDAKTRAKNRIKNCIDQYGWCIIGSHIWKWTVSDTTDETSLTTANLFEIISYANSLAPIKPVEVIWDEQKMMYELNK